MSDERKKPSFGFLCTVALTALALYALSFGPAAWLLDRRMLPAWAGPTIQYVYWPICYESSYGPRPIRQAIEWYASLGAKPREERIYDIPGTGN